MHSSVFLHLSGWSSITALRLQDIILPSPTVFCRLVSALPSLRVLTCVNTTIASHRSDPHLLPKLAFAMSLDWMHLSRFDDTLSLLDVVESLLTTKNHQEIGRPQP